MDRVMLPFVSDHAFARLRERLPAAADWHVLEAARKIARWIKTGTELGGQHSGSRVRIVTDPEGAGLAIVYRQSTETFLVIITVLSAEQAHVNAEQFGSADQGLFAGSYGSRVGRRRGRRSRLSKGRADKKRTTGLAFDDADSDYPDDETRRNNRRRRKPAHHSRRRGTSAGESGEGFD